MRCETLTTPAKTVVRRRSSRQSESTNRSSMCVCPLSILEETAAVTNLAPHEHAQTVEFHQPQFINKIVDDRVTTQRQNPTVQVEMRRCSREVSWWIPVVQQRTDNREQMPQETVPESSEEVEVPQLATGKDAIRNQTHEAGKDF